MQICLGTARRRNHEKFRHFIRVELPEPLFERGYLRVPGLDDELSFLVALDAALPSIDRRHRRQHVHAGGEPLLDERSRQSRRIGVDAERGEDDDGVDFQIGT